MATKKVSAEVIPADKIDGVILTHEEFAAIRELANAARRLHDGAKMMRALGTGGIAPGDGRMRVVRAAIEKVDTILVEKSHADADGA